MYDVDAAKAYDAIKARCAGGKQAILWEQQAIAEYHASKRARSSAVITFENFVNLIWFPTQMTEETHRASTIAFHTYILRIVMPHLGNNARLNFRRVEENHIMENVIFNELKIRGYSVDVGIVEVREMVEDKRKLKQLEIDFIANKGNKKYYIQSAYEMPTEEKLEQEKRSLNKVNDSFKKIVIVKENIRPQIDEYAPKNGKNIWNIVDEIN